MLQVIKDALYCHLPQYKECPDYIAECVLQSIENEGMLPPFDPKIHWSNWDITDHGHKWEKE